MRLPPPLLESQYFLYSSLGELSRALGDAARPEELAEIEKLVLLDLPPVTSRLQLATIFGVNPGLIWSFENRTRKHYRSFFIPKGRTTRQIDAPKVALKIIQKWLSVHLSRGFKPEDHVFGFVSAKSHIQAAALHVDAQWVFSVDIQDFFPSTPIQLVMDSLEAIGFGREGAMLVARLSCLAGFLAQGAPTSPVLSNICFRSIDEALVAIATRYGVRMTRYADDIVFSGMDEYPEQLETDVRGLFSAGPWTLAEHKVRLDKLPARLKVHGLLVHGSKIRLTKGYRNRLRAYRHLMAHEKVLDADLAKIKGHLNYAASVDKVRDASED